MVRCSMEGDMARLRRAAWPGPDPRQLCMWQASRIPRRTSMWPGSRIPTATPLWRSSRLPRRPQLRPADEDLLHHPAVLYEGHEDRPAVAAELVTRREVDDRHD